jgi:aminopeptidase N
MRRTVLFFIGFIFFLSGQAQIDVQHYKYEIELSDQSDVINGKAWITLKFLEPSSEVVLDLISVKEDKGMQAFSVKDNGQPLRFLHKNNKIMITLSKPAEKGEERTLAIEYMGNPDDGLVISLNKYGERTFFSDNWPNRAMHWLPANDVPSDKASVEFIVIAPSHYKIISNGLLIEEKDLGNNKKRTHWKEIIPLPTKVMAIGVANFAVSRVDNGSIIPVTAWVFKKDSLKGVYDYALGDGILNFFESYIAPYPFKKLANVQSKTIFGGMENASAIFYEENTLTGTRSSESLMAHEIAHQWFGNVATEKNFAHLWLSEGFATYLTDLYMENRHGRDSMVVRLEHERDQVVEFAGLSDRSVVDSVSNYMDLLNPNSYQKGAWVLHMLRVRVGDKVFRDIVRSYYESFKLCNADTEDFIEVAERVSGQALGSFFAQWLYWPGIPKVEVRWRSDNGEISLEIMQKGKNVFQFPLSLAILTENGSQVIQTISVANRNMNVKLNIPSRAKEVILDPRTELLFEGSVRKN